MLSPCLGPQTCSEARAPSPADGQTDAISQNDMNRLLACMRALFG